MLYCPFYTNPKRADILYPPFLLIYPPRYRAHIHSPTSLSHLPHLFKTDPCSHPPPTPIYPAMHTVLQREVYPLAEGKDQGVGYLSASVSVCVLGDGSWGRGVGAG
jgi:hypothetical protein